MRLYGLGLALLYRQGRRSGRSHTSPADGFVYVIRGDHGMVKVGSSSDPERRLAELQTGSPYRLWIDYRIAVSGHAADVEFSAHDILDAHRGLGEWFAVPTEAAIAAIHASAFQLGVGLGGGAGEAGRPNWMGRLATAALIAAPFWGALALGHPVVAMGYLFLALVFVSISLTKRGADREPAFGNFCRWVGASLGGAAIPVIPAIIASNVVSAIWP